MKHQTFRSVADLDRLEELVSAAADATTQRLQELLVAPETFAPTDPESNDKLRKDTAKVANANAACKYVFLLSPLSAKREAAPGVTVVRLDHSTLSRLLDGRKA